MRRRRNLRGTPSKHWLHNAALSSSCRNICGFSRECCNSFSPSVPGLSSTAPPTPRSCPLSFLLLASASLLSGTPPTKTPSPLPMADLRNRFAFLRWRASLHNTQLTYHSANFDLKKGKHPRPECQLFKWKMRNHLDPENIDLLDVLGQLEGEVVAKDFGFGNSDRFTSSFAELRVALTHLVHSLYWFNNRLVFNKPGSLICPISF